MTSGKTSTSKCPDLDNMISSMTREINNFWSHYDSVGDGTNTCPIYRVPEHIREIDRVAYEPIIVSFGPYNHGAQHLQTMEKKKWERLDRVLKLNCGRTLYDYIKAIASIEKQARKCYSEQIIMERKKFVQMLLLDGCFILVNIDENVGTRVSKSGNLDPRSIQTTKDGKTTGEELGRVEVKVIQERERNIEVEDKNCYAVADWLSGPAWHDMFLLENQIPFFVVERIYVTVTVEGTGVEVLRNKTAEFIENILRHYPTAIQEFDRPKSFYHLLHLCHIYLRPSQEITQELQCQPKRGYFRRFLHLVYSYLTVGDKPDDVDKNVQQMDCFQAGKLRTRWHRAVEYHQAGVQFKRRECDGHSRHSLLDIRFMGGVIEVPCLPIDESSESLFKNLLALEQMDPRFGNDISAYVTFMSQVITTPDDVSLLVQRGIILHMLDSDEEVSTLFTRLTKQVTFRFDCKYYLKSLCQTLEAHYQSRLNRWMASLWFNHFRNPWLALAALAASLVLACTIVQTVYTVLAYVKPPWDT